MSDEDLCTAVRQVERGLIDADLGSGLFKQRIGRKGQGKSGGFRVMVVFKTNERAFFVHGFAKKDISNITPTERAALKKLAKVLLSISDAEIAAAVRVGTLIEVYCNGEALS